MSSSQWVIRPVLPEDLAFIYNSWLKSYKFGSESMKSMRSGTFFENYREILDYILTNSEILIACLPEDENIILGYICYENILANSHLIHYCFIKETFRNLGIATDLYKSLYPHNKISYTHETKQLKTLINNKDKYKEFTYNPLLLYRRD